MQRRFRGGGIRGFGEQRREAPGRVVSEVPAETFRESFERLSVLGRAVEDLAFEAEGFVERASPSLERTEASCADRRRITLVQRVEGRDRVADQGFAGFREEEDDAPAIARVWLGSKSCSTARRSISVVP